MLHCPHVLCRRGIACQVDRVHDAAATKCDPGIIAGLAAATAASRPLLQRALTAADAIAAAPSLVGSDIQAVAGAAFPAGAACRPGSRIGDRLAQEQLSGGAALQAGMCHADSDSASGCICSAGGGGSSSNDCSGGGGKEAQSSDVAEAAIQVAAAPELVVPELVSGAGHDALAMAEAGPMGMLFVRCRNGGISHSPAEKVDDVDVAAASAALLAYLHVEVV